MIARVEIGRRADILALPIVALPVEKRGSLTIWAFREPGEDIQMTNCSAINLVEPNLAAILGLTLSPLLIVVNKTVFSVLLKFLR